MTIKRKKKLYLKTKTRDLILEEAERIIAAQGIDNLKLEEIAQALGIQRPAIYAHFKGREGILAAIAEQGSIHLINQFQNDDNPDPVEAIKHGVDDFVSYFQSHPAFTLLMARNIATADGIPAFGSFLPDGEATADLLLEPLFQRINNIIARGCETGQFEPIEDYVFFHTLLCSTIGCIIHPHPKIKDIKGKMTRCALGLLRKA